MSKMFNLQVDKLPPENHIGLKQQRFTNIRGFVACIKSHEDPLTHEEADHPHPEKEAILEKQHSQSAVPSSQ